MGSHGGFNPKVILVHISTGSSSLVQLEVLLLDRNCD